MYADIVGNMINHLYHYSVTFSCNNSRPRELSVHGNHALRVAQPRNVSQPNENPLLSEIQWRCRKQQSNLLSSPKPIGMYELCLDPFSDHQLYRHWNWIPIGFVYAPGDINSLVLLHSFGLDPTAYEPCCFLAVDQGWKWEKRIRRLRHRIRRTWNVFDCKR